MNRRIDNTKNYLELKVPVRQDAEWFSMLRETMEEENIPVRWQNGWFHITVAFVDDNKHVSLLLSAFDNILRSRKAASITIDRLGVFKTQSGRQLVLFLEPSKISDDLKSLIESLRNQAMSIGANMQPDFKLHITLGRIDTYSTNLQQVKRIIEGINIPPFTLTIKEAEYRFFRGNSIREWSLPT